MLKLANHIILGQKFLVSLEPGKIYKKGQSTAIHLHRTPAGHYQHLLQTQVNPQELRSAFTIQIPASYQQHHCAIT